MNIYVANLNYKIQSDALRSIFESYGEVSSARVITDKLTGRSRGFGFVEMNNDEEAQKAIQELNGAEIEGKTIAVSEARPRPERTDNNRGTTYRSRDNNRPRY